MDRLRAELSFTVLLYTANDGTDEGTPERAWRIKTGKARPPLDGSRSCTRGGGAALLRPIAAIASATAGISAAYRRLLARHRRLIRRVGIGSGILAGVLILALGGLWWRLSSGPIQLDAFTPMACGAIADNFGSRERVEVGGTQIERTENGGAAVRVRDIVVRDPDGTVVARAPKAEIRVSGMSLLSGHMRAESLNLVGAELAVHIEQNGAVTVFASGADTRPLATAAVPVAAAPLSVARRTAG